MTAADSKSYNTRHYNLAVIIVVGYKVNSEHAVPFRQWATTGLKPEKNTRVWPHGRMRPKGKFRNSISLLPTGKTDYVLFSLLCQTRRITTVSFFSRI
ncbi:MAG: RhuM family protein [Chlorobiaceae bacterium]